MGFFSTKFFVKIYLSRPRDQWPNTSLLSETYDGGAHNPTTSQHHGRPKLVSVSIAPRMIDHDHCNMVIQLFKMKLTNPSFNLLLFYVQRLGMHAVKGESLEYFFVLFVWPLHWNNGHWPLLLLLGDSQVLDIFLHDTHTHQKQFLKAFFNSQSHKGISIFRIL